MTLLGEVDGNGNYEPSKLVELEERHADDRGYIQMLTNIPTHNVSLIDSKKGTVRSNHYHFKDWHYIYMLTGACDYYFRAHDSGDPVSHFVAKAGDMIWTPPMEDHATVFTEDSLILALSLMPRDQEAYESDVRRIVIVDPATLELVA
ncbi:MAG: hypothetical protein AAF438_02200 [Pseudomonadota bacterium]